MKIRHLLLSLMLFAVGGVCAADNNMPVEIAPVEAPFTIRQFTRPVFPDHSVRVKMAQKGLSTKAIQKAIDKMAGRGGGTVIIPDGDWQTGRIIMKSNVNIHLSDGCVLHFSGEIKDYLPVVFTRDEGMDLYSLGAFFYANGQTNIALTGKGRVVGPSTDCEVFQRNKEWSLKYNLEQHIDSMPLSKRVFDGKDGSMVYLPKTFSPINCKGVFVEGVTFDQGLFWNVVPQYCTNVIIRGVTVTSYGHGRTDGIDIDSSEDVLIEYCSLDCQDDCYTIKSGRGTDGIAVNKPTKNVVVRNSIALRGAGGIVCGTETAGGIQNVYCVDCEFKGTDQAFRFKTRRPRGGLIENIYVERIKADVRKQALFFDMLGSSSFVGGMASRFPIRPVGKLTPKYRNVFVKDAEIANCRDLIDVRGLPESPIENVVFENITAKCQTIGKMQDTENFVIKNVKFETEGNNVLTIDNSKNSTFTDFFNKTAGEPVKVEEINTESN